MIIMVGGAMFVERTIALDCLLYESVTPIARPHIQSPINSFYNVMTFLYHPIML